MLTYSPALLASHDSFEKSEFTRPILLGTAALAGTYFISVMDEGPAVFAGLYSMGALYLLHEWKKNKKYETSDLIVPFGLLSLALVNITLLRDHDRYSQHDIFIYNTTGIGLLTAYTIWVHEF